MFRRQVVLLTANARIGKEEGVAGWLTETSRQRGRVRFVLAWVGVAVLLGSAWGRAQFATQGTPRKGAGYVLPNGAIQVVAAAPLVGMTKALDDVYAGSHAGVSFSLLSGDNYSAMAALTFDRSAFAPMGSEYTKIGLGDNLKIAAEPLGVRVAHAALTPGETVPALGIIVNAANPISSLSMAQVVRIFAVGGAGGDLVTWGQAGVKGELAGREIHPAGPLGSDYLESDDPQAGEFISTDLMQGLNMNHRYEAMAHYADVVKLVREDPAAIGIVSLQVGLGGVKVVALKRTESDRAVLPSAAEITAGHWPMDRAVYVYLRVGKGAPIDDFAREYVRIALSPEGQRAIAADKSGYLPLNAGDVAQELQKLD